MRLKKDDKVKRKFDGIVGYVEELYDDGLHTLRVFDNDGYNFATRTTIEDEDAILLRKGIFNIVCDNNSKIVETFETHEEAEIAFGMQDGFSIVEDKSK